MSKTRRIVTPEEYGKLNTEERRVAVKDLQEAIKEVRQARIDQQAERDKDEKRFLWVVRIGMAVFVVIIIIRLFRYIWMG